jgi:lysine biosynthesis protein LysW
MAVAYCLNCGDRIYLGHRPWVGQAVDCDRCGADLEVTQVNPLDLDWTDNLVDDDLVEGLVFGRDVSSIPGVEGR